jgi:hypothetical protein
LVVEKFVPVYPLQLSHTVTVPTKLQKQCFPEEWNDQTLVTLDKSSRTNALLCLAEEAKLFNYESHIGLLF